MSSIHVVAITMVAAPLCGAFLPEAVRDFIFTATLAAIFSGIFATIIFLLFPRWSHRAPAFAKLTGLMVLFFLLGMAGYGMRHM